MVRAREDGSVGAAFELLRAVDSGELLLAYQPVFDLTSNRMTRVEALVRWTHPDHGLLLPGAFLPSAAQPGIAEVLNSFVLETALAQHRAWADSGFVVPVAVNVAPDSLRSDGLVDAVNAALDRHGVEPAALTLEMTETRADLEDSAIARCLAGLSRLGVRISLDDFGTRDASLGRLRRWRFDEIKLDREFVSEAAIEPIDRSIISFAAGLAHDLGISITAEGITSPAVLDLVRELGVDEGQGFHLGRPTSAEGIVALLVSPRAATSERGSRP